MSSRIAQPGGDRGDQRRPRAVASGAAPLRHHVVRDQRLDGSGGGRPDHQRARRGRGEEEELYFVHSGRARFELDGESVDAPAGTFVFARPGVKRTAFAEEPGTTILAVGGHARAGLRADGLGALGPVGRLYQGGEYDEAADKARDAGRGAPASTPCCSTTSPAARASPAVRPTRSSICGWRSRASDSVRSYLAEDSDLDPLREEPEFQELLAGTGGAAGGRRLGPGAGQSGLVRGQRRRGGVAAPRRLRRALRVREQRARAGRAAGARASALRADSASRWRCSSPASRPGCTTPSRARRTSSCSRARAC